jgi:methionine synthase II (cobalamin-independent)
MEADTGSSGDATVYRADVVGSMLRPDWLVEARQRFRAGTLAPEAYREIEDRAVAEAISIQEQAGVDVLYAEAAEVVHGWVRELFAAGCRYVQIDAPEFNEVYADARVRAEQRKITPETQAAKLRRVAEAARSVWN